MRGLIYMKSSALGLAALLLLFASALDARAKTKRAKRSGRRSNTGDNSGGTSSYEYDASDCNGSWDVGSDEELQLGLPDDRCDFEEVSEADFNRHVFMQRFSLRRPLIVRQSSVNERAREMISSRCEMLRRYGALPVELGDPFSLAKHGRSTRRMSLGEYLETAFQEDAPLYFFDRSGQWSKSMRELSELVSAPDSIFLRPQPESSQIIFAMGKTGSGIGLHQHQDAFNQVLLGRKRWTVYPGTQSLDAPSSCDTVHSKDCNHRMHKSTTCVPVGQATLVVFLLPQATILRCRTARGFGLSTHSSPQTQNRWSAYRGWEI